MSIKKMTERQLRVWQNFVVLAETIDREVGRDLWDDAGLTKSEFTVLAELSSQSRGGMRPSQCARAIDWDTSRLSHMLRRMEKRRLVSRGKSDGSDGRAAEIVLTKEGRSAYRRALGPHLGSAKRWFADALDEDRLAALDDALGALLGHVQRTAGRSAPPSRGIARRTPVDETQGPPARKPEEVS
ncbi:MAG: hypothetical protein AVDCRST_MAG01-01-4382 [uncultured Rubrobacteraceae bacterium]|uniref:HTH marR-type domain-containing protein n=1 Tax=uncultured Rubrobacteraceae bacterium TaxID=349277 RepID=A0A6J4QMS4_9ACTN|nr:MAG: hypothetical protein AVDCRST_MAG01-01-4382 [uncultured Rubrobacteraceae bacterium]